MNAQPKALRLADVSRLSRHHEWHLQVDAELRRLHGLDFALRNCELALKKMATKYMDAVDQRDALLEALKAIEPILARMYGPQAADLPPMQIVRAAIKQAEENT